MQTKCKETATLDGLYQEEDSTSEKAFSPRDIHLMFRETKGSFGKFQEPLT
jgi:hypothetical protein